MPVATLLCLVVAISDGDTIKARCGDPGAYEQITIRISAIDAPEKAQDFGNVSRQNLATLCFHETASITPKGTDRYRRTIADVTCKGRDVGEAQVQSGLAWYYVKYGKGYEHLAQVERRAREEGRGLWSTSATEPWDWRTSRSQPPTRRHSDLATPESLPRAH